MKDPHDEIVRAWVQKLAEQVDKQIMDEMEPEATEGSGFHACADSITEPERKTDPVSFHHVFIVSVVFIVIAAMISFMGITQ